jgi:hypothetical protein
VEQQEQIAELKKRFLEYYADVPVKRYASYHIGRDEDTTRKWEKSDADFSEQIRILKAKYLLTHIKLIKDKTWLLERLFRDEFGQKVQVDENVQHTFLTYEEALKIARGEIEDVSDEATVPEPNTSV